VVTSSALWDNNSAGKFTVIIGYFVAPGYIYLIAIVFDSNVSITPKTVAADVYLITDVTLLRV